MSYGYCFQMMIIFSHQKNLATQCPSSQFLKLELKKTFCFILKILSQTALEHSKFLVASNMQTNKLGDKKIMNKKIRMVIKDSDNDDPKKIQIFKCYYSCFLEKETHTVDRCLIA